MPPYLLSGSMKSIFFLYQPFPLSPFLGPSQLEPLLPSTSDKTHLVPEPILSRQVESYQSMRVCSQACSSGCFCLCREKCFCGRSKICGAVGDCWSPKCPLGTICLTSLTFQPHLQSSHVSSTYWVGHITYIISFN